MRAPGRGIEIAKRENGRARPCNELGQPLELTVSQAAVFGTHRRHRVRGDESQSALGSLQLGHDRGHLRVTDIPDVALHDGQFAVQGDPEDVLAGHDFRVGKGLQDRLQIRELNRT